MSKTLFFLFLFQVTGSLYGQSLPAPFRLRTDFLLHTSQVSKNGRAVDIPLPVAIQKKNAYQFAMITSRQPVFSWQVKERIVTEKAFRILVASSPGLLEKNQADCWDSKKTGSTGNPIQYNGKPLRNDKIYYWKVQVWNENNEPSSFSAINSFYYKAKDSSQAFSHYPLTADLQTPLEMIKKDPGSWFLDFGKDGFGQLQLHLDSEVTDSIWVEVAEALVRPYELMASTGNIRYTKIGLLVEKGDHHYAIQWPPNEKRNRRNNPVLMPDYIGEVFPFRYVMIRNFKGKLDQQSVQRKMVFYPFEDSASWFSSNDTVLNQVWDLCKYTEKATSFSGYYVDGDRERVPYEADALINQLSHYAVDPEYSMARRSMAFVIYYPTWPTEWSLQNILLAWNDYMYTGEDSFLKEFYTELQKKLLMPLAGENGLISTRTGKQTPDFLASIHFPKSFDNKDALRDNVDWPQKGDFIGKEKEFGGETDGYVYQDYNAVVNAFYYRALVLMAKIASVTGHDNDALWYTRKADEVYTAFQQIFRDPQTGLIRDGDSSSHTSLHANMFALVFGLVREKDIPTVIAYIKTRKMACSVYGAQFLLEALYDNQEGSYALSLLNSTGQRSWYNMIRSGSSITMEAWDKLYKPNLDWNHAWGAAPANIIVRKMMGIEPLTPGFNTFRVKPQLGELKEVSVKTTTIKGEIIVSCKRTEKEESYSLFIPGNTRAKVILQYHPERPTLYIDNIPFTGQPENGFFVVPELAAGHHKLIIR